APGRGAADASPTPGQGTADAPETPGGPFADDAARLDQVVEALSSVPESVLRPAPAGPASATLSGPRETAPPVPARPGPQDPEADAWARRHRAVLDDALRLLTALGPESPPRTAPLTAARLEQLVNAWFRAREQDPSGSLTDRIRRILDDIRA
ncbi:hypothetical protein G3I27_34520, partial [Streptomyces sp. SID10692]|nr:hypothetical protein [Streptomyces sp. SID10692]